MDHQGEKRRSQVGSGWSGRMERRVQAERRQEAERLARRVLAVVLPLVVPLVGLLGLLPVPVLESLVVVEVERVVDFGGWRSGVSGEEESEEGSFEEGSLERSSFEGSFEGFGCEWVRQGRLMVILAL